MSENQLSTLISKINIENFLIWNCRVKFIYRYIYISLSKTFQSLFQDMKVDLIVYQLLFSKFQLKTLNIPHLLKNFFINYLS